MKKFLLAALSLTIAFFCATPAAHAQVGREKGEAFLIENAKKEGVKTLPSGLQYRVIKDGDGKRPTKNDQVVVHYKGTLIDGREFDSSHKRGEPAKFGVTQVFSAAGASTRQFKKIQGIGQPPTRLEPSAADYFDLTPDDDQKMIVETVNEFAEEFLRPAARDADEAADRAGRRALC